MIHADVSADLLRTIFAPRTPLHDGAVIIRDEMILAAGALLPLAEMTVHTERFGTRHRAALGHHRADRRRRHRRLRGERPDQPRRAGPDRAQPQRAAAGPGDPLPARADGRPGPVRAPRRSASRRLGGRAPRARRARPPRRAPAGREQPQSRPDDDGPAAAPAAGSSGDAESSRFFFHNWPLKLAAIVLATMLYAGLVASQSVQELPTGIAIVPTHPRERGSRGEPAAGDPHPLRHDRRRQRPGLGRQLPGDDRPGERRPQRRPDVRADPGPIGRPAVRGRTTTSHRGSTSGSTR